ncbi:MAG: hypothetical protein HPY45_17120 [Anaerolineae bacterium]|nr:hypothetical protein [Anaerolineae bacterium]
MKKILVFLLLLFLLIPPSAVLADVAPPYFPPGANPQPGAEATQVRMVAETVLIEVQNDTRPGSLASARIRADFTMHNLGGVDEQLAVRFPISASNGRGEFPEITDMVITVNGRQVNWRRANYPALRYADVLLPWAEFDVQFPAAKDTLIQVAYTLKGTGYPPYTAFYYVLETGAGWKGSIGSADIILRLPYAATPQNVVLDMQIGWASTTPGAVFEGNEARWHFEDFEPGEDGLVQNMEFVLVTPAAWQAVLKAQQETNRNPGDGEAWGRLGRAYKQIFFVNKGYREDDGGRELYDLSLKAYQKCLEILPGDAQWHAGFADLLVSKSYWESWGQGPTTVTLRGIEEIHTALQLAPNDPKVREIAASISSMFPEAMLEVEDGYDFPWLTQTPVFSLPTQTPVMVFTPSATSTPEAATPTDTPAPSASDTPAVVVTSPVTPPPSKSPLCASAALVPAVAVIGGMASALHRRRRGR